MGDDESPESIGPFRVKHLLGRGGMGEVWLAHDEMLDREVAVKVLAPHRALTDRAEQRLIREARAASSIDHPNIVRVHQLGQHEGRLFIAMEFVRGRTLARVLSEDGPLPPEALADVLDQCAAALGAAHAEGLVHRDVKPDNLLLRPDGHLKVLDFGLVHAASAAPLPPARPSAPPDAAPALAETLPALSAPSIDATQGITAPGAASDSGAGRVAGTPLYMAPEQLEGRTPTPAADQYALASSLYELATGAPARRTKTLDALLQEILEGRVPPPPEGLPRGAGAALLRALERDPGARHDSVEELARAFRQGLLRSPSEAPPRRGRRAWIGLGAVAALGLGGLGWMLRDRAPSRLRMGVTPGNRVLFGTLYQPLAALIAQVTEIPTEVVIPSSYEAFVEAMVAGELELGMMSPRPYVLTKRRLPDLELLAGHYYQRDFEYLSVIVARRELDPDAPVAGLPTIRAGAFTRPLVPAVHEARFCLVDPHSTSGYVIPLHVLEAAGVTVPDDRIQLAGDHYNVLRRLADGACDVGAVSSMQLVDAPRQAVDLSELVVLTTSSALPPVAFVGHPSVPADVRAAVRSALTDEGAAPAIGNGIGLSEESATFGPVSDEAYDILRGLDAA